MPQWVMPKHSISLNKLFWFVNPDSPDLQLRFRLAERAHSGILSKNTI